MTYKRFVIKEIDLAKRAVYSAPRYSQLEAELVWSIDNQTVEQTIEERTES